MPNLVAFVVLGCSLSPLVNTRYTATWESLDSRKNPLWFDDAKFGIFMHWGLYSVPAFDSSEWFWGELMEGQKRQVDFMAENYRPGYQYQDFASDFRAQFFDPNVFAEVVKKSGAKYFVVTTKHHEGYCMWPCESTWNWNSVDTGPHRDIIGDLEKAFRANASEVAFGLYFSLLDWAHPYYLSDKGSGFTQHNYPPVVSTPQLYDIVKKYKPDVVWGDGNWEASSDYWNTKEFLAWMFNESYGGNLLMDIGPTSAGTIIPIFEERLSQMGAWLDANGEAVYGTKPWIYQNDTLTSQIWYTSKLRRPSRDPYRFYNNQTKEGTIVYATFSDWPVNGQLVLGAPRLTAQTRISMLGYGRAGIGFKAMGNSKGIRIDLAGVNWVKLKSTEVWVLKLEFLEKDNHNPFG